MNEKKNRRQDCERYQVKDTGGKTACGTKKTAGATKKDDWRYLPHLPTQLAFDDNSR